MYRTYSHHWTQEKEAVSPAGLDLHPAVYSWPSQPVQHWPTIVMILTDRATELAADRSGQDRSA
jgi:hypothetical protein